MAAVGNINDIQGLSRRKVHCISKLTGELVHDSLCQDTKPGVDKSCSSNQSCVITLHHKTQGEGWLAGAWGQVSVGHTVLSNPVCYSVQLAVVEDTRRG